MGNLFMHTGKTFSEKELRDRAAKALKLNGFDSIPTLYPISPPIGSKAKPTIRIKPLENNRSMGMGFKLKGASAIQDKLKREKEKAEKALKLNSLIS